MHFFLNQFQFATLVCCFRLKTLSHQFISPRLLKKVKKRNWVVLLATLRGIPWKECGIISRLTLNDVLSSVAQRHRFGEEQQQ